MSRAAVLLCAGLASCSGQGGRLPAAVPVVVPPPSVVLVTPAWKAPQPAEAEVLVTAFEDTRKAQARIVGAPRVSADTVMQLDSLDNAVREALKPWRMRRPNPTGAEIDAAVEALGKLKIFLGLHGQ